MAFEERHISNRESERARVMVSGSQSQKTM
jgi:hypothetical protein